jgi:ferrous iron transport protein A
MPCACGLRVKELAGSPALRSRLYAMGILPGTEIELCTPPCGKGSVCVRVRRSSLVLGETMAKAILCRPVDALPDGESAPCAVGEEGPFVPDFARENSAETEILAGRV